jgi:3-oxoacyl-[acyl-carrier-protein] synthase II
MTLPASQRVVITGLGLVSPLGNSAEQLWSSLIGRRSGVRCLQHLPAGALPVDFGAEAWDFSGSIENFGPLDKPMTRSIKKGLKMMCREIQMGVAVAQLALLDAGFSSDQRDPDRTGVVYGSDHVMTTPDEFVLGMQACLDESGQFEFSRWASQGLSKVDPLWLLKFLPNMPASHVAIFNDLRGPNNSITLREAAANLAVGEAYATIRRGHADAMLAGATGTRIHALRSVHVALQETLAVHNRPVEELSRPFDRDRTGMVLGEGAGAILLERLDIAERRGARIVAEVVGHGSSTVMRLDGTDGRGLAVKNAVRRALQSAGKQPADIGHVHAHGLGTVDLDCREAEAIQALFGNRTPVAAAKSYFGNLGAGSGMVELIASSLALSQQQLFPHLNFATPDPACPIHVASDGMPAGPSFVNINVSPQGQASAVVVQRWA